jgi:hypothetical protein
MTNNKQQTAVEWFWNQLPEILPFTVDTETAVKLQEAYQQAKEMEKEQMMQFVQLDTKNYKSFNIYITSDEEIKDSWVLNTHTNEVYFLKGYYGIQPTTKKIILTTDQDLIKDGVQSIDDEFLKWFVKNPNCEEVEVKENLVVTQDKPLIQHQGNKLIVVPHKIDYKIIIPKEKPKQETLTYTEAAKKEERIFNSTMMSKQETLEEAAERVSKTLSVYVSGQDDVYQGFIEGAKWESERMYSEEEVEQIARFGFNAGRRVELKAVDLDFTFEKWFEQFKKKQ